MKTTLEIPDDLFRRSKAIAALRGESLKQFVAEALCNHVDRHAIGAASQPGWKSVFGKARPEEVEEVAAIVARDLDHVDLEIWKSGGDPRHKRRFSPPRR